MASQLETLRLIAPEFASINDVIVQSMLDISPLLIDPLIYPENVRGLALVYQACILLAQRNASADGTASMGGTLTREKEGDLERQLSVGKSKSGAKNQYEIMLDQISMPMTMGAMTRFEFVPGGIE